MASEMQERTQPQKLPHECGLESSTGLPKRPGLIVMQIVAAISRERSQAPFARGG